MIFMVSDSIALKSDQRHLFISIAKLLGKCFNLRFRWLDENTFNTTTSLIQFICLHFFLQIRDYKTLLKQL